MTSTVFRFADFPLWVIAIGAMLVVATSTVTGHRLHRWLFYNLPALGRRLPPDAGAWLGFAFAILLLSI